MTSSAYAIHEAGHAVVGTVLGLNLLRVTLQPQGDDAIHPMTRGATIWDPAEPLRPEQGINDWAGPLAARYFTADGQVENENDADIVRLGALAIILDPTADPMILAQDWYHRAYELLSEHRRAVYSVSAALDEYGTLTGDQVRSIVERAKESNE